jgi:hypothetical protein
VAVDVEPARPQPHPVDDDEAWTQLEMTAVRRRLLDIIHRFYLDAISRLPPAELRRTDGLARGLLVGGHCFGPLHPIHNIVVNSIWYAAAFPLRRPVNTDAEPDDDDEVRALLSSDGLTRIVHRSLDGLLATLHHLCPSLSTGEALWKLFSAGTDLTAAIALANGTSTSSALRVIASEGLAAFHVGAEAARHPDPTAFAQFASSVLPAGDVQDDIVHLLLTKQVLATRHINYLSNVLVSSSPHESPRAPLMLSPQVLDRIASQRKQINDTGKQNSTYTRMREKKGQKRLIYSNLHFSELELLSQPNTSPQLQRESPTPRWSCKLVELLLQSWFREAGALPNTPLTPTAPNRQDAKAAAAAARKARSSSNRCRRIEVQLGFPPPLPAPESGWWRPPPRLSPPPP